MQWAKKAFWATTRSRRQPVSTDLPHQKPIRSKLNLPSWPRRPSSPKVTNVNNVSSIPRLSFVAIITSHHRAPFPRIQKCVRCNTNQPTPLLVSQTVQLSSIRPIHWMSSLKRSLHPLRQKLPRQLLAWCRLRPKSLNEPNAFCSIDGWVLWIDPWSSSVFRASLGTSKNY